MLKQACIVLAISGLVLGLGARHGQAGWSDARSNLTLAASSPVVSIKKHKNDDDDDDNNNDDNHHGKGKKNNEGAGLSECTIIQPGGGGGCKTGLKWVCEKMKSGNKCCGCVADKSKGTSTGQSGGDGKTSGAVGDLLASTFGSLTRWEELFRATGMSLGGGSGWVALAYELTSSAVSIVWSGNHTQHRAASVPLLVMDMYEHAYQMDYGAATAKYIDAFFANLHWIEVNRRLERAQKAATALRG